MCSLYFVAFLLFLSPLFAQIHLRTGPVSPLSNEQVPIFSFSSSSSCHIYQSIITTSSFSKLAAFPDLFIGDYVPDDSFFVFSHVPLSFILPPDVLSSSYAYPPHLRISPDCLSSSFSTFLIKLVPFKAISPCISSSFIVSTFENITGIETIKKIDSNHFKISIKKELIREILPIISELFFVHLIEPFPEALVQNFNAIQVSIGSVPQVLKFSHKNLNGKGQIIAVTDTGIDHNSCYFRDLNRPIPINQIDYNHRKVILYRALQGTFDSNSHGTFVAGTLAGESLDPELIPTQTPPPLQYSPNNFSQNFTNNKLLSSFISSKLNGIAPKSKLIITDVAKGSSLVLPDSLYHGLFLPHYQAGARIDSNSWAFQATFYGFFSQQTDQFLFDFPDYLLVFAAGNSGELGFSTVLAPALAKNVLAVGASYSNAEGSILGCCNNFQNLELNFGQSTCCPQYSEMLKTPSKFSEHVLAHFSSTGPTVDLRYKPDIIAPGVFIQSANVDNGAQPHCKSTVKQGSSMATPLVSGAAAIIRQYFLEGYYIAPITPSASLIKAVLFAGTADLSASADPNFPLIGASPSIFQGTGRLNLTRSLPIEGSHFLFIYEGIFNSTVDYEEFLLENLELSSDFPLKIVVAWTDPPSTSNSKFLLVSDLDLVVFDPDDVITYGNMRKVPDFLNNYELVLPFQRIGIYRIRVVPRRLPLGFQSFSIAITTFRAEILNPNNPKSIIFKSKCPQNCNQNGKCHPNTGTCECFPTSTGQACELPSCLDNCNGRGVCISNKCRCNAGYIGEFCSIGFCQGTVSLNSRSGTISSHDTLDGFGLYENNADCSWMIAPSNIAQNERIFIEFSRVSLENGYDFVEIFDGLPTAPRLARITGSYPLVPQVVSTGPSLFIRFTSDERMALHGFLLSWRVISTEEIIDKTPTFDCFGVGVLNRTTNVCDCHGDFFVGNICSVPNCRPETTVLPQFTQNFEFTGNRRRTLPLTFHDQSFVAGGPFSKIFGGQRHSNLTAPIVGTIAGRYLPSCFSKFSSQILPSKRYLASFSLGFPHEISGDHSINFDFEPFLPAVEIFVEFFMVSFNSSFLVFEVALKNGSVLTFQNSPNFEPCFENSSVNYFGSGSFHVKFSAATRLTVYSSDASPFILDKISVNSLCSSGFVPWLNFKSIIFIVIFLVFVFYR
ncbi:hypothetical protein RCL1_008090 [Eukaryota sp. TZLM3-RCL]